MSEGIVMASILLRRKSKRKLNGEEEQDAERKLLSRVLDLIIKNVNKSTEVRLERVGQAEYQVCILSS